MGNNEMKRRSRALSLLLVVILVISMLVPVTAFAYDEDDDYEESKSYTVVLHANRPGRAFSVWNSNTEKNDYKVEITDSFSSSSTYRWFDTPGVNRDIYKDYADYSDGYRFDGWAKTANGAKLSDEDGDIRLSDLTAGGTTHLYAKWKKEYYVITYDAGSQGYCAIYNDGMENGKPVIKSYQKDCDTVWMNTDSISSRMCYPNRNPAIARNSAAYAFDGWYYDAAFRNPVPDAGFSVSKDVTLYAKFINKAEANATKAAATSYYNKAAKAAKKLKVSGSKASAAGKKKANVKWKANKKASGYQIQYSLKKNFKNAKTVNVKGAKKKIRKLKGMKKGKTYYIRIRTYQNVLSVNNTKVPVYGKWSKKMKVKVK